MLATVPAQHHWMMQQTLSPDDLARYIAAQANIFFPDPNPVEAAEIAGLLPRVIERTERCFAGLANGYFRRGGELHFDHLHSEQYSMFLYLLGHEAWKAGLDEDASRSATKFYLLNKALHGCDVFFQIELPEVFWLAHPVGTVLGRAEYGNGFAAMQGCSVGNKAGVYPRFGERVLMCANSSVIGGCRIGDDVCIGAGAMVIDTDVPDGSTVVGCGKGLRIIPKRSNLFASIFHPSLLLARRSGDP